MDLLVKLRRRNIVTRIPVEKRHEADAAETEAITEQIRQLAYHLFESRGGADGRDVDDWLAAERELTAHKRAVDKRRERDPAAV